MGVDALVFYFHCLRLCNGYFGEHKGTADNHFKQAIENNQEDAYVLYGRGISSRNRQGYARICRFEFGTHLCDNHLRYRIILYFRELLPLDRKFRF